MNRVNCTKNEFSNHWNFLNPFFQSLETFKTSFPTIGSFSFGLKLLLLCVALLMFHTPPSSAEIIAQVTFENYKSNADLNEQSADTDVGVSGVWTSEVSTVIVTNKILGYQKGEVRILGGTNAIYITKGVEDECGNRKLTNALTRSDGKTRYCGFLMRNLEDLGSSERRMLLLDDDNDGGNSLGAGVYGDGDKFSGKLNNRYDYGDEDSVVDDTTYYLVFKFQSSGDYWTNVTVFVNPTNTTAEQAEQVFVKDGANYGADPDNILLFETFSAASDAMYIDEITIGTTWGDVVYSNATHPTVVLLYNFTAATENDEVVVRWRTAFEKDTAGFMLYRLDEQGERQLINSSMISATGEELGASYSFVDTTAEKDTTYDYILVEYELDGSVDEHGPFNRTTSELQITSPVRPVEGGFELHWLSRPDEFYNVLRADSLISGFEPIAERIPATPPENIYKDETDASQAYYRIGIDQD